MLKIAANTLGRRLTISLILITVGFIAAPVHGGGYLDSAHGNSSYGVNRSILDGKFANYATGNCAHCHESHASIDGVEPAPAAGPASHAVFAESFNAGRAQNPYLESDNFCFYCHSDSSGQQVVNRNYSSTFGGGDIGTGPQSVLAAFNQTSYHNLFDIWTFLNTDPGFSAWFAGRGNPCSGCHNPHLAKRNWDGLLAGFPLLSAISKPAAANSLWGEAEVMSAYLSYEAPYSSVPNREPAGVGDPDGASTPDYAGFCGSCHNTATTISSTTLGREVKKINWQSVGLYQNKHGELSRDGSDHFREPYATAAALKSNFVLSCLDCHEPHGSFSIVLLRSRVNGEELEGTVDSVDAMTHLCKRCHTDDLTASAGTNEADKWEFVHHLATDAPYPEANCVTCHASGDGSTPVACGNCHGHGMDDSWAGASQTGRITF